MLQMTAVADRNTELEHDVADLRDKIRSVEQSAKLRKEAADVLLKEKKAAGLNPVSGLSDDDKEAFDQVDSAYKEADGLFETAQEYRRRLQTLLKQASEDAGESSDGERQLTDPDSPAFRRLERAARRAAFGEKFTASEQYRQLKRSGALDMQGASIKTAPVQVATRDQTIGALFTAAQLDGGPMIQHDQTLFPPIGIPARQLRVRDLVLVSETDSDTIDYVEETTRTDAAAETPYGTAAPEATYVYTPRQVSVKRIPHALPATKGNLADESQLRGFIDGRLIYGVGKRLDTQMISGDAVGDNIRGILNTTGIGTQALGADSRSDALHKGMTVVRIALEDEPDAFVLHPTDYEEWALEKGTDGHYLTKNGPQNATPMTIWGKPAVTNTVVGVGTGIVGAWRQGATLWVRSGVAVAASDSHSDFFTKGLVMLLAEMRAAFAVVQPKAFATITGI